MLDANCTLTVTVFVNVKLKLNSMESGLPCVLLEVVIDGK